MYDSTLTQQSLPSDRYRLLLGTAICVFTSNNGFIIENLLRVDESVSWHTLIDQTSGRLRKHLEGKLPDHIIQLFFELVGMRNRIIHGFRITNANGEQTIATKDKSEIQFEITEDYLIEFIHKNNDLSNMLHEFRGF